DARHAGNVVGGVAPQADDVDQLIRSLDTPFCADFPKPKNLGGVSHSTGLVDENLSRDELAEVLVRRHHVGFEALILGAAHQRADDVVGLEAVASQYRDIEGIEE